jgi:hypothetical protein
MPERSDFAGGLGRAAAPASPLSKGGIKRGIEIEKYPSSSGVCGDPEQPPFQAIDLPVGE